MNIPIEKYRALEKEISEQKGQFFFFALLLHKGAFNKWDLVVSAPWIEESVTGAIRYIVAQMRERFTPEERLQLSRVATASPSLLPLDTLEFELGHIDFQHELHKIRHVELFGAQTERGYIITAKRPESEAVPA